MSAESKIDDVRENVAAWVHSVQHQGSLDVDSEIIVDSIMEIAVQRHGKIFGDHNEGGANNSSAIAAFVLGEGAEDFDQGSESEATAIVALGYLLTNIDANPDLYLNPRLHPTNEVDTEILKRAKLKYGMLANRIAATRPDLMKIVRVLEGSVRYVFLDDKDTSPK